MLAILLGSITHGHTLANRLVGRSTVCQHCNGCTFDGEQFLDVLKQVPVVEKHPRSIEYPVLWNDGLASLLLDLRE